MDSPSLILTHNNENSPTTCSAASDDGNCSMMFQYPLSPSMDSPPLTPPEIKVDISSQFNLLLGEAFSVTNVLSPNNLLPPVLKTSSSSSKRGRSASNDDTPDVQALKRHIMIRNRESASLSKKKKKDYVTGLESRIHDLEKESDGLKKENSFLRSKLQQLGAKVPPPFSRLEKKGRVGVMAKVALLGLFGFVMVNFHTTPPAMRPTTQATEQHSNNLSQFSRTLTKLQMSDDVVVAVDNIPLILTSHRQFITREDETNSVNMTTILNSHLPTTGNLSKIREDSLNHHKYDIHNDHSNKITTPTSYLNGTTYNQTHTNLENNNVNMTSKNHFKNTQADKESQIEHGFKIKNRTYSVTGQKSGGSSSRWRSSRGLKKQSNNWTRSSSLKSATTCVFPPFTGSTGVTNSTKDKTTDKCPNQFNKTESLRVKNDLENIFGRKKFSSDKKRQSMRKVPPVYRAAEPIVYSLVSHTNNDIVPLDFNKGLTLYEGEKKKYSNILEKLERREDTFYVVSLAPQNQLLLSAKASNESSRPKTTLLLPWRNETMNEDMILQIDCEVFQVFNLNEKKEKQGMGKKSSRGI